MKFEHKCYLKDSFDKWPFQEMRKWLSKPEDLVELKKLHFLFLWFHPHFPRDLVGDTILETAVECGFYSSNSDVYRSIKGGAFKVNGKLISRDKLQNPVPLLKPGICIISRGKKHHHLIVDGDSFMWYYKDMTMYLIQ